MNERFGQAPIGYWQRANNSRYTAYVVFQDDGETLDELAENLNYDGNTDIARGEAFLREAAISLELIIKTVIAQRNENSRREGKHVSNVPHTHDVVKLWKDAKLPKLDDADNYRLLLVKSLLSWSGRYVEPRKESILDDEQKELRPLLDVFAEGTGLPIVRTPSFHFEDHDRLYKIALSTYSEL